MHLEKRRVEAILVRVFGFRGVSSLQTALALTLFPCFSFSSHLTVWTKTGPPYSNPLRRANRGYRLHE